MGIEIDKLNVVLRSKWWSKLLEATKTVKGFSDCDEDMIVRMLDDGIRHALYNFRNLNIGDTVLLDKKDMTLDGVYKKLKSIENHSDSVFRRNEFDDKRIMVRRLPDRIK